MDVGVSCAAAVAAATAAVVGVVVYIYTCGLLSNGSGAVDFFDVCVYILLLLLLRVVVAVGTLA